MDCRFEGGTYNVGVDHGCVMTESEAKPVTDALPSWSQAMQGKGGNAKRIAATKRLAVILSLTFFGCFLWLYILYNVRHNSQVAAHPMQAQTAPAPNVAFQQAAATGTIAPAGAEAPVAVGRFGSPRVLGVESNTTTVAAYGLPTGQPPLLAPPYNPASMAGSMRSHYGSPAAYAQTSAPHQRGDLVISASRDLRHAIGNPLAAGMANAAASRQRLYVSR